MCDHWRPASASPAAVGLGRSASVGSGASASGPRAGAGVRASFRAPGRSAGVVPGTVMAAPCEAAVPDKNEPARQAIGAVAEGPHAPKPPQEEGAACTQVPVLAAAPAPLPPPLPPPPPPCLPARIVLPKRGEWLHVDSPGVVVGAENLLLRPQPPCLSLGLHSSRHCDHSCRQRDPCESISGRDGTCIAKCKGGRARWAICSNRGLGRYQQHAIELAPRRVSTEPLCLCGNGATPGSLRTSHPVVDAVCYIVQGVSISALVGP
jgi:hypothetical protein